jgi:hypothetical protein
MRKGIVALGLALIGLSNTGCIFNQYGGDPNVRTEQLIHQSEDYRQMGEFWRRFWHNDMPSHLTPERIHGGIMK